VFKKNKQEKKKINNVEMLFHIPNTYLNSKEFEDIKGVIRIRKSKDRQNNGRKEKVQITI
jgi:hypothetical protein